MQAETQAKRQRTQWAAQFAAASELCKRGYEVAFTQGNHTPLADLMCVAPQSKAMFLIDVKGLGAKTMWMVKEKETRESLFYLLTYVPQNQVNRFFVVPQADILNMLQTYRASGIKYDPRHPSGFNWTTPFPFEDRWELLPA